MDTAVYGEPLRRLWPVLQAIRDSMKPIDGGYEVSVLLQRPRAEPLRRALLRAEAELLLEEADSIGTACEHERTPEERTADALVRVCTALP
jgi:uncharacterized lipoprotein YmbA